MNTTSIITIALVIFTVVITFKTLRIHWQMKQSTKANKAYAQAALAERFANVDSDREAVITDSTYNLINGWFPSGSISVFDVEPVSEPSDDFKALMRQREEDEKPEPPIKPYDY